MLKLVAVLAATLAAISAVSDSEWLIYKDVHSKVYEQREDYIRRMIYEDNVQKIQAHNELYAKGEKSYYLGVNQFADMSNNEFSKTMNRLQVSAKPTNAVKFYAAATNLPKEVDWVKKGYVTPVKNQGQCGSCWSFSTTGSVEGQHFKQTGKLVSLSEKNLMDCSRSYGNNGCEGGLMDLAFKYIIQNKGLDTEQSYPYVPKDGRCHFNRTNVGATITSFQDVDSGSEASLQESVARVGPVSVAIDASQPSFQLYGGGVYDEEQCGNSSGDLDHGVLTVGYGTYQGKDYWLVKNSWGTTWGNQGYIMMSRNKDNQCGIATSASYPIA